METAVGGELLLGARDRGGRGHGVPQVAALLSAVCARGADGGVSAG